MRKGQITLFIILGIVLLFIIGIGIYTYSSVTQNKYDVEVQQGSELALEAQEVERFVDECVKKTTFDGLEKLGRQGGYILVPSLIQYRGTAIWFLNQTNIPPTLEDSRLYLV